LRVPQQLISTKASNSSSQQQQSVNCEFERIYKSC
jgi:hypothetical protein